MASKFDMATKRTPAGRRYMKQLEKAVFGERDSLPVDCVVNRSE